MNGKNAHHIHAGYKLASKEHSHWAKQPVHGKVILAAALL